MSEARAHIKFVRISAQKLRVFVDCIKIMKPHVALDHLSLSQNRSAKVLFKAIKSALDNGVNNHGMNQTLMKFKTLMVDEGRGLKRFRAGARGTAKPYVRPLAHITVVLEEDKTVAKVKSKTQTKKQPEKVEETAIVATKEPKVKKAVKNTQKKK